MESDVQLAFPVVEEFLGKKPVAEVAHTDKKERHILVPIDFSEVTEKVFKTAFNIASHLQVKLVLMHCYINPLIHSIPFSDVYAYDPSLLEKMESSENEANEKFHSFVLRITREFGKEKWESVPTEFIIKSGYADEDILAYSEKKPPDTYCYGERW
jgi:nucleotide-binding universal stress UspA family protein